jgi:O-antigen ligase
MFSVFLDPNFAGAFFVLFLLFLVSIFLKKKSILIGLILILTLGAIFLTFSRSALIMLIISTSLLFILMSRKKLIILLFAIVFIVILISSRYFNIANINLFRVASSEARIETAKDTLKVIQSRPILGIGFNAYRYAQVQYGLRNEINVASHADASTDNSFLFVMATTGIVGLILYLFLWFRILKIASVLVIASVVGVFVDSLFINSLFYPSIMLWLWIVAGLA